MTVCQFHSYKASNRDGEVEWSNNRLQIGEAAGERIDRNDVSVAGRSQGREAEIQHVAHLLRLPRWGNEIGEGAGIKLPNQAVGRCENCCKAQVNYDRALKAVKGNSAGGIDGMCYDPGQRRKDENVAASAKYLHRYRRPFLTPQIARGGYRKPQQDQENSAPFLRQQNDDH